MFDLAGRQRAVRQVSVDDDVVLAVRERLQLPPAHAEAPLLLPVRGAVRDQVGIVRMREDVSPELVKKERGVDRNAVAEDVERGVGDVDDPLAPRPLDPRRAEVPLARDSPVEDLVPVGVSTISSGTSRARTASVSRTPAPVRLRGSGRARP